MTQYATVDPTTGKVMREFPTMSDPDVEDALGRADTAYRSWSRTDLTQRAAVLSRVAELQRHHATELAKLMTLEMGKPVSQSTAEVRPAAAIYEYYASKGSELIADEELDITAFAKRPMAAASAALSMSASTRTMKASEPPSSRTHFLRWRPASSPQGKRALRRNA
jgi:acyl-CoA reductase-like NAD-dependent aldehyde dehydrogenase